MLGLEQITRHLGILNPIFLEDEGPLCVEEALQLIVVTL